MPLPRAITGGAWLDLGGRRWWLRITYGVLLDCEEASGTELLAMAESLAQPPVRLLRDLLWAALKGAGAQWGVREVGAMLTLRRLAVAHRALLDAWLASMPEAEKASGKRRGPQALPEKQSWVKVWAWATSPDGLGISSEAWLDMTPRQLHELERIWLRRVQREEWMAGTVAAAVANYGYRAPSRAISAETFMAHPFEPREEVKPGGPVTGEMIMAQFAKLRR